MGGWMKPTDQKRGKRIRSANRLMELHKAGEPILFTADLGMHFYEVDVAEIAFADVMDGIKKWHYWEVKK